MFIKCQFSQIKSSKLTNIDAQNLLNICHTYYMILSKI
ncbi:hypothetical protein AO372_0806 [Moraxella catarrhalis]|nr:hypothetical protein AO381_0704 [Moraxella catarrhalis]OAV05960.1 hypothetical protein AO379_1036 [Moraxella catarrhalis]OAV21488.1 hypothetical protein AO372_0806 [Moraxella catarrhalis]OAV32296.1 hypothetical protein AO368_0561 [Moraxella catarrhalis]